MEVVSNAELAAADEQLRLAATLSAEEEAQRLDTLEGASETAKVCGNCEYKL